ncbi:ExeM/NucH family extracellular endonuclease [Nocardioides sp. AE5]|uniref:ExeM/NucH family extracellular endonuclease n=1 Tax=Nocardioides sp. AE5 TaxID=2962573 RepID=UPI0028825442|nr:ExeM/NucH family extracellular endonuclease [Nocardioides sp. AE5]MDT0203350.1 ExeM/NucH family extracellular endonuclease [Nocardioides sp. AE5]
MSRQPWRSMTKVASAAAAVCALAVAPLTAIATSPASAAPAGDGLVISEVYGGGGNSGATYTHDFIELYNPTSHDIPVEGWSVQWRSASGSSAATGVTPLTGSVPAGGHYLVQQAKGNGGTQALPTPDVTGTVAMGASNGTAILVKDSTTAIDPGTGSVDTDPAIVDLVGVDSNVWEGSGAAPAMSNTTSVARAADGADTDNNQADFNAGAPTPANSGGGDDEPDPDPEPVTTAIAEIQGTGATTPLAGQRVTTRGVVTAAYPSGGLYGFYLQEPGSGGTDLDLATHTASQGIFVYQAQSAGPVRVEPGDHVEVTGTAGEHAGATQVTVTAPADIAVLAEEAAPVVAVSTWPTSPAQRESLEGMLYRPAGDFTVTETYGTSNYGEVGLARGDTPLLQWTQVARPGSAEADAVKADNATRGIVLDDGSSASFAGKADLTPAYISNDQPVRVGARATFTADVIFTEGGSQSAPTYRFQPLAPVVGPQNATSPASFENTRTDAPDEALLNSEGTADIKVASFNVLNYFTTLGDEDSSCQPYDGERNNVRTGCDQRGAWDAEDLQRQQAKIVTAINALDADVVALMEIENSAALGEPADEATTSLVDALNADAGGQIWAANPSSADLPPLAQQDVITNAIIYRRDAVTRTGAAHALGDQSASGQAFGNAREPIAQAFTAVDGGEPFLVVVNHFKSKGSAGPFPGDADTGDGQGASNASRVKQAEALRDWLPGVEAETGAEAVLLTGDFNSYAMEDPLQVLADAGYVNVEQHFGLDKWSYNFSGLSGSLDHILANEAALERATGADIWNINGGESVALEYSRWNYWATDFHDDGPFRSSDHDPVIVGLTAGAPAEDEEARINLLSVNDFHGRINGNTVKWAGTIEQLRADAGEENTLLIGAGDLVGASEFASSIADDQPTIDVLNTLGMVTSAVGNHEFDKGSADLRDRIIGDTGDPNAQWDYLGANVYHKGTSDPALQEYALFEVDGLVVGVIGVVTVETPDLVSPDGVADLDFGDATEAVNRVAAQLTDGDEANGEADVIVANLHAGAAKGVDSDYPSEVAKGGEFAAMADLDPAVDVILNAHTHQVYAWQAPVSGESGATRPLLQTGEYGANIGQVELTVDRDTGEVTSSTVRNVPRSTAEDEDLIASYPRLAEVKAIVDAAMAQAAEIGNQPIAEITADITTAHLGGVRDDRASESTLGELVANAFRDGLPEGMHADLGIVNAGGGLRAELLYAGDTTENPANTDGVVTYAEANAILPFVNNMSLVEMTGADIKQVLEQQWDPNRGRVELNLGLSDNVTVTTDPSQPLHQRITSVLIDGKPLDPDRTYTVSTVSFLAAGGDSFTGFTNGTSRDTGLVDRDLWISYLEANSPLSPDFARQQVQAPGMPEQVEAGDEVAFELNKLDLTSLGSPTNTEVEVFLLPGQGEPIEMGTFAVTEGSAVIQFTAPADLAGPATITAVASPSGTVVGLPLPGTGGEPGLSESDLTDANRGGVRAPETASPGHRMELVVGVEYAGQQVEVLFFSDPVSAGVHRARADGTVTVMVPTGLALGAHKVAVVDLDGALIGWDDITLVPASSDDGGNGTGGSGSGSGGTGAGGDIPGVGGPPLAALWTGALFLILGMVLALRFRRRVAP